MRKITLALVIACFGIMTNSLAQAPQYRRDIHSYTTAEQNTLATLMHQYITVNIIEDHCNMTKQMMELPMPAHIHDDLNFLPFHRAYLEGMEDFLLLQGHPEFVPLPAWDPGTSCPLAFRTVDPDCTNTNAVCDITIGGCNAPTNWQPLSRPGFLKLPIQAGSNNDLCDWHPGTGTNSFTMVVEGDPGNGSSGNYHNSVHNLMTGVMRNFNSPSLPAFWIWHAYVDDIWKEYQCQCANQNPNPRQIDLYIKNTPGVITASRDMGVEPNWGSKPLWESTDIWVRNNNDGFTTDVSQNPEYSASAPVYVYVRVRNRGCASTIGSEIVKLYWSKAGAYQLYPKPWDGTVSIGGVTIGGMVASQSIGQIIPPGGEAIIKFDWYIPNPALFGPMDGSTSGSTTSNGWHFCLLARGDNPTVDPDLGNMNNVDIGWVVADNNHIAWKNMTVVDFQAGKPGFNQVERLNGGTIAIGNLYDEEQSFDFFFEAPISYNEPNPLTDHAEIIVSLNPAAWEKWTAGGRMGDNIREYNLDKRQILITGHHASLKNMTFQPSDINTMNVAINFLTEEISSQHNYDFRVTQRRSSDSSMIGGESYTVIRPDRMGFMADAGNDKSINDNESAQLSAASIGESAIYNWYDSNDSLIYSGQNFTVSPEITTQYKLEVIATEDGFKDYDKVTVNVKENYFTTLAPNPTSGNFTVGYKLSPAVTSAYIIVMQPYGTSNNYILNLSSADKTIDLSSYIAGTYNVILVCNGQIADAKTIVKQ